MCLNYFHQKRRYGWSSTKKSHILSSSTAVCLCVLLSCSCEHHALGLTQFRPLGPKTPFSIRNRINIQHTCTSSSSALGISVTDMVDQLHLPFSEISRQMVDGLDIGDALNRDVGNVPEAATSMVLESIGRDLLVFLSATVIVTPVCISLGITPILGYLIAGALLGSHGLDVFSNSKADVELGDFGILFLLFSEGLEVSTSRLQKLTQYIPLGAAQISLTAGVLTGGILIGAPFLEKFVPLDEGLININSPVEALVLALAGTLSTSAFVFPVLKDQGWEEEDSGQAATSILLLQDLLVAPLLVILPYLVGAGETDYSAIGFLTAKATLGFGLVIFVGSGLLRKIFELVARARSTETFVATCLLVSAGMGVIAKSLGLTDTVGAFTAGILLANTNYRAQIQADILPFKGILLGIFFMDAGTSFNSDLVIAELPTILTGVFCLIMLKATTMLLATRVPRWMEPNRLTIEEGIKVALLLAGGGEFAFVVLALAEKLDVLPPDLGGLLTAIVLITMAVTPALGQVAEKFSATLSITSHDESDDTTSSDELEVSSNHVTDTIISSEVAKNAIVVCGYGAIGQSTLQVLADEYERVTSASVFRTPADKIPFWKPPKLVAFDTNPLLLDNCELISKESALLFGDSANPEVLKNSGISDPTTIFVFFEEHNEVVSAVSRLRACFPAIPIYARSRTEAEAETLREIGANEVIVEQVDMENFADTLAVLNKVSKKAVEALGQTTIPPPATSENEEKAAAIKIFNDIVTKYPSGIDGAVHIDGLANALRASNRGIASDEELDRMEAWIRAAVPGVNGKRPINETEFCELYRCSPSLVQEKLFGASQM